MLEVGAESLHASVARWLAAFETAIARSDSASIEELFLEDGHWRDLLAFTWDVRTSSGAGTIAAALWAVHPETVGVTAYVYAETIFLFLFTIPVLLLLTVEDVNDLLESMRYQRTMCVYEE